MSLSFYETSAELFIHGLTNLKALLQKGEDHVAASGVSEAVLLRARLSVQDRGHDTAVHPNDAHMYALAAQVHWAAEGAKLAVAHLLGEPMVPAANEATSFADLYRRLDATIAYLRDVAAQDLEVCSDREIVIKTRLGSLRFTGSQFLLEYAIPHFFYHVTSAYGILRNQGVQLNMGEFLGNSARASAQP